jgi:hypothetical protein
MNLNGKAVNYAQLKAELIAAGIAMPRDLGQDGDDLHTYDGTGAYQDLPNGSAAVVAAHVSPLPLIGFVGTVTVTRRLRTTDATPGEVFRATLATNTAYAAQFRLIGVDAANGVVRRIRADVVAKRLASTSLVGTPTVIANHQDTGAAATTSNVAGWAISASISGNDFVVTAAGAAGRTVDWLLDGDIASFAPGGG